MQGADVPQPTGCLRDSKNVSLVTPTSFLASQVTLESPLRKPRVCEQERAQLRPGQRRTWDHNGGDAGVEKGRP